jgi:hypothetical protein
MQGSSGINPRGTALLEYLGSMNLETLNQEEPTFFTDIGQEILVIHLTLYSWELVNDVHTRRVMPGLLLDHRHALFSPAGEQKKVNYRIH